MSERSSAGELDFESLRRAIEHSDPDSMLRFYADDARVRVRGGGSGLFEVEGKAEVAKYLRAVHARRAVHRVENESVTEGRVYFEESCEYPDGGRTVVGTTLDLREGEISRQVDVVLGRDARSERPESPVEPTGDRRAQDADGRTNEEKGTYRNAES